MSGTAARPKRVAWLAPLVVNAPFGYVAVLPVSLVWYFLANYPPSSAVRGHMKLDRLVLVLAGGAVDNFPSAKVWAHDCQ